MNRETKAMRLIKSMIRVLAEDNDFSIFNWEVMGPTPDLKKYKAKKHQLELPTN